MVMVSVASVAAGVSCHNEMPFGTVIDWPDVGVLPWNELLTKLPLACSVVNVPAAGVVPPTVVPSIVLALPPAVSARPALTVRTPVARLMMKFGPSAVPASENRLMLKSLPALLPPSAVLFAPSAQRFTPAVLNTALRKFPAAAFTPIFCVAAAALLPNINSLLVKLATCAVLA